MRIERFQGRTATEDALICAKGGTVVGVIPGFICLALAAARFFGIESERYAEIQVGGWLFGGLVYPLGLGIVGAVFGFALPWLVSAMRAYVTAVVAFVPLAVGIRLMIVGTRPPFGADAFLIPGLLFLVFGPLGVIGWREFRRPDPPQGRKQRRKRKP